MLRGLLWTRNDAAPSKSCTHEMRKLAVFGCLEHGSQDLRHLVVGLSGHPGIRNLSLLSLSTRNFQSEKGTGFLNPHARAHTFLFFLVRIPLK